MSSESAASVRIEAMNALARRADQSGQQQLPDTVSDIEAGDPEHLVSLLHEDRARGAELLVELYGRSINRTVWRLLGADPDHDDIVQQVFYTVMTQIHQLREPRRLSVWIQSITVNTAYGELRKREVRRVFLREQPKETWHPDLSRDVEVRDLLGHARTLLHRMPAKERVVFILYHVEGCTLREVAELCRCSLSTAKRRLASSDRRLTKMLKRTPGLEGLMKRRRREGDDDTRD